jgi:hypothetical protein
MIEQMPKAGARKDSDVRAIIDNDVETFRRSLFRDPIKKFSVVLFAFVGADPGAIQNDRIDI